MTSGELDVISDAQRAENFEEEWNLPMKHVFQLALKFFKEMEGKAVSLSYEDKLKLVAFSKQVVFGVCNEEALQPLGVLDVIGKNRRLAWKELGNMSQQEAMSNFIELLNFKCILFKPYIEAHVAAILHQRNKESPVTENTTDEESEEHQILMNESVNEDNPEELKRRLIQDALNQQTYTQFRAYAEEQFPGNPEQQAVLVRQLQDQHYHQYMAQLFDSGEKLPDKKEDGTISIPNIDETGETTPAPPSDEEEITEIAAASMWTLDSIRSFKQQIRKEGGDAIIKIGHGETVTVRVPTHENGSCLYWEFCTDHYDLGFGIFFEWTKSPTNQVSVHVSETDDEMMSDGEDDDDDDDDDGSDDDDESGGSSCDLPYDAEDDEDGDVERQIYDKESGHRGKRKNKIQRKLTKLINRTPISIISPVMRRDCHQEVYAGSHCYPGEGVYLLKFDNSYSLWRSKTLYYRVFYTR